MEKKEIAVLSVKCAGKRGEVVLTDTDNLDSHRMLIEDFCKLANAILALSGNTYPKIGIV